MIFVTIGTANKGFDRLIEEVDRVATSTDFDFFSQIGHSQFVPKNHSYSRWLSKEDMNKYYKNADVIISHGGFGTISEVLQKRKKLIVMPRLFEFKEAVNDQQDLTRKLSNLGYLLMVNKGDNLQDVLDLVYRVKLKTFEEKSCIPNIISNYLKKI